ncbi:MAG: bifunctional proline dehydrogenase/L-glutamate gamma-semialdehyde dehydrogenase PutA [Pseudomonadota bacterium]
MTDSLTLNGLEEARQKVRAATLADETELVASLGLAAGLHEETRAAIAAHAASLVERVRAASSPGLMETFLAEYGLSTDEGIALMCLAEALLRVPDAHTIDALIEDKITPGDWGKHLGQSSSSMVNASTWALLLTGRVLDERGTGLVGALRGAVKRVGEPVIRAAVAEAMRRLGSQFVLGETIESALHRAAAIEEKGYTYSYDMLGEAARTFEDAERYRKSYADAIAAIATKTRSDHPAANPGISVKLSALYPRYEFPHRVAALDALVPLVADLCAQAADAGMGLNIDAEEQDRLDLSLDVIAAVVADRRLRGWDGFGVVVQAYGRRVLPVIEWVGALAEQLDRRLMVRLVKGAYWDTEIKRAQVVGTETFPVFTRKAATDVSYLAAARALLQRSSRLYPQFATHNAHTVAAVLAMARGETFEFQRLHGMGEALYEVVRGEANDVPCRIYAPVGAHEDLLAYLVRRLLENGANSSFANQIVDTALPASTVAADPFETLAVSAAVNGRLRQPPELYGPGRRNAKGWDLFDPQGLADFEAARAPFADTRWAAAPIVASGTVGGIPSQVLNPAKPDDRVGSVKALEAQDAAQVVADAEGGVNWGTPQERARVLCKTADLYEANAGEFFALAAREAGKTPPDAVAELREAVDFLRYYAGEAERLAPQPRGVVVAISPWNFPLAIFTGQIAAALAAGNAVIAKPAAQTPLIAARAAAFLHEAGVPRAALQFCPGGGEVGAALVEQPGLAGVAFTGSTATARRIDKALAKFSPEAVLVAETGGINAMIVDSTALPEQAVRDILASAFQSAGQRCSALRILYVQEDVSDRITTMLAGAMNTLLIGDPWDVTTDIGPVIDRAAKEKISAHRDAAEARGAIIAECSGADGLFLPPVVIRVGGIEDLDEEIFGPVLHLATYKAEEVDEVIAAVNGKGYGLTFGLHTRIDDRVDQIVTAVRAGNIYVNRNQIGAIVGSQPFGGEGLSGTGPKAGGPRTVARLSAAAPTPLHAADEGPFASRAALERAISGLRVADGACSVSDLPGPTGESNRLSTHPRGVVVCAGPGVGRAREQARAALVYGNAVLVIAPGAGKAPTAQVAEVDGVLNPDDLRTLQGIDAVAYEGDRQEFRAALSVREGPILPVYGCGDEMLVERHLCIDTAAAGGNARLLSSTEDEPTAL